MKKALIALFGIALIAALAGCASQDAGPQRGFRGRPGEFDRNFDGTPPEGFDRNFEGRPGGFDEGAMFARMAEQLGLPEGAGKAEVLQVLGLPEGASMEEIRNAMRDRNLGFYGGR